MKGKTMRFEPFDIPYDLDWVILSFDVDYADLGETEQFDYHFTEFRLVNDDGDIRVIDLPERYFEFEKCEAAVRADKKIIDIIEELIQVNIAEDRYDSGYKEHL